MISLRYISFALVLALSPFAASVAKEFQELIRLGDENRSSNPDESVSLFDKAFDAAPNDTDRGIALVKKAEVFAYNKNDMATARSLADQCLALKEVQPVAKVTAYSVKAHCMMNQDSDYAGALDLLNTALLLEGVDWAKPSLLIKVGDCHRMMGDPKKALKAYEAITSTSTSGSMNWDVSANHSILLTNIDRGIIGTAHLNIGITYQYSLRDNNKAKKAYDDALSYLPHLRGEVDGHLSRM